MGSKFKLVVGLRIYLFSDYRLIEKTEEVICDISAAKKELVFYVKRC